MTILGNIYPSGGENGNVYPTDGLSPTIKAGTGVKGRGIGSSNSPKVLEVGFIEKGTGKHQSNIVYSEDGVAPTIMAGFGVKQQPTMWVEAVKHVVFGGEQKHQAIKTDGICTTLTSSMGTGGGYVPMVIEVGHEPTRTIEIEFLGSIYGHGTGYAGAVYNANNLCPSLTTMQGGGREPHILEIEHD